MARGSLRSSVLGNTLAVEGNNDNDDEGHNRSNQNC